MSLGSLDYSPACNMGFPGCNSSWYPYYCNAWQASYSNASIDLDLMCQSVGTASAERNVFVVPVIFIERAGVTIGSEVTGSSVPSSKISRKPGGAPGSVSWKRCDYEFVRSLSGCCDRLEAERLVGRSKLTQSTEYPA